MVHHFSEVCGGGWGAAFPDRSGFHTHSWWRRQWVALVQGGIQGARETALNLLHVSDCSMNLASRNSGVQRRGNDYRSRSLLRCSRQTDSVARPGTGKCPGLFSELRFQTATDQLAQLEDRRIGDRVKDPQSRFPPGQDVATGQRLEMP